MKGQGRRLLLEINTVCNLKCRYCYHQGKKTRSSCENPNIFKVPKQILSKLGIKKAIITGGEPLLDFQSLLILIEYFSKLNVTIELITNGTLLTQDKLRIMENRGLDRIAISLERK